MTGFVFQVFIKATGDKGAELVTDQGAIYVTSNGGYNWKAAIQETVSATLNRLVSSEILFCSLDTFLQSTKTSFLVLLSLYLSMPLSLSR